MFRTAADDLDGVEDDVVPHRVAALVKHVEDGVDVPPAARGVLISGKHHVAGTRLEGREGYCSVVHVWG